MEGPHGDAQDHFLLRAEPDLSLKKGSPHFAVTGNLVLVLHATHSEEKNTLHLFPCSIRLLSCSPQSERQVLLYRLEEIFGRSADLAGHGRAPPTSGSRIGSRRMQMATDQRAPLSAALVALLARTPDVKDTNASSESLVNSKYSIKALSVDRFFSVNFGP